MYEGHYEFLVMLFDLSNAPSTFQSLMNDLFWLHLRKFIPILFNDILIYSTTWTDHLFHLRTAVIILSTNNLFVKKSKCRFEVSQVNYLGHFISSEGVAVNSTKIQLALVGPFPRWLKRCTIVGLARYYHKFIQGFGRIAAPLNRLLTKMGFIGLPRATKLFTASSKP